MKTIARAEVIENFEANNIQDWIYHSVPVEAWYVRNCPAENDDILPDTPEGVALSYQIGDVHHSIVLTEETIKWLSTEFHSGRERLANIPNE